MKSFVLTLLVLGTATQVPTPESNAKGSAVVSVTLGNSTAIGADIDIDGSLNDVTQILKGVTTFLQLVDLIAIVGGEEGAAVAIIADLAKFTADSVLILTVAGYFTTLSKQKNNQKIEQQQVMDNMTRIVDQIETLQANMGEDFEQLMSLIKQEACFVTYQRYEQTLISAGTAYKMYLKYKGTSSENFYKNAFIQSCTGYACDRALQALMSSLIGNQGLMGCDLMDLLYRGAPAGKFYVGWRDFLVSKNGYLISLTSQGLMHISAYYSLTCTSNCSSVPINVHSQYYPSLHAVLGRLPWYEKYCNTYINDNAMVNVKSTMWKIGGRTTVYDANDVFSMLQRVYPWKSWMVDVSTQGNQLQSCNDCFVLWALEGYNLLVAYMDKNNTQPPNPVLFSLYEKQFYQNVIDGSQQKKINQIIQLINKQINECGVIKPGSHQTDWKQQLQSIMHNQHDVYYIMNNLLLKRLCSLNLSISGIHIIGRENHISNAADFPEQNWWLKWGEDFFLVIWYGNNPLKQECQDFNLGENELTWELVTISSL